MPKPLRCDPVLFSKDLTGKVIIVTGCTSGTGLCTAEQLVKQKATVIIASRKEDEGRQAAAKAGGVFMKLDLTSLQIIKDFCEEFKNKYDRLDVLVNNAGVMMPPLTRTQNDFELQMGTNHFGHFLLTEMLRDLLEKSAPSRVVNLSSCAAAPCNPKMGGKCEIDFTDLHWKSRKYDKGEAYAQSKLANILHATEISKRYKGVTAYSLHPGWVQSQLMRHNVPGCCKCCIDCCAMKCSGDMINVWDGSQASLHCILSDPENLENGAFYSQFGIYQDKDSRKGGWPLKCPNPQVNEDIAKRLWEVSLTVVGLDGGAPDTSMQAPTQQGM